MNSHAISRDNIEQSTLLIGIATRNVIRLAPDDCVSEAARIMAGKRIAPIAVTDGQSHPADIRAGLGLNGKQMKLMGLTG